MKRIGVDTALWVVLVAWVLVIWAHSLMPGDASSSESGLVLGIVRPAFEWLGVRDVSLMHHIVRKAGHFLEYFVLGVIVSRALRPSEGAHHRMALLGSMWICIPAIDETIQMVTPGRVGALGDVLIDMVGFGVGLLVATAIVTARHGHPS